MSVLSPPPPADETDDSLRLSWRLLALVSSGMAGALLTALVIIGSVRDVETLSTVALALAIVAFVMQFVAFVAQSWDATRQLSAANRLNSETMRILTLIQASTDATSGRLLDQHDTMIARMFEIIATKEPERRPTRQTGSSAAAVAAARRSRQGQGLSISPAGSAAVTGASDGIDFLPLTPAEAAENTAILEAFKTPLPTTEFGEVEAVLPQLETDDLTFLTFVSGDEQSYRGEGQPGLRGVFRREGETGAETADRLVRLGLLERHQPPEWMQELRPGEMWLRLTPRGRQVARLLGAERPLPDRVVQALDRAGIDSARVGHSVEHWSE